MLTMLAFFCFYTFFLVILRNCNYELCAFFINSTAYFLS